MEITKESIEAVKKYVKALEKNNAWGEAASVVAALAMLGIEIED